MLMIRLSRIGRKKHPHYRLVIAEKARDTYGHALEILGHYHPLQKDEKDKLVINKERIEHWLKNGAQASNTVKNLLIDAGVIKGDKERTIGLYKSKKAVEAKPEEPKAKKEPAQDTAKADDGAGKEAPAETLKEEVKEEPKAEKKPAIEDKKTEAPKEDTPAVEEKKEETPKAEATPVETTKEEAKA